MFKKALKNDVNGATIIEYALIASLIAVVAMAAMKVLGTSINSQMQAISEKVSNPSGGGGGGGGGGGST